MTSQNSLTWTDQIRICVDSYQNKVPKGRIQYVFKDEEEDFKSLMELFIQIEAALDLSLQPQAFTKIRSFQVPGSDSLQPAQGLALGHASGALATFMVRILFRQNASWQGEIRWLDDNQSVSFRSALELSLLMDSALSQAV